MQTVHLFDSHTHSHHSHDAVSQLDEMASEAMMRGLLGFAVTDHYDGCLFMEQDIVSSVLASYDETHAYAQKHADRLLILTGIEIGEGFWNLPMCEEMLRARPFDVRLGSVHAVKDTANGAPYSLIRFSEYDSVALYEYLKSYLRDVRRMLDTIDFDVLTHLTCPLRYINLRYGKDASFSPFKSEIDSILRDVISRGIALEVNVAPTNEPLGPLLPDASILLRYKELGGKRITLASDAHVPSHVGHRFSEKATLLKELGFDTTVYYQNRIPHEIKL